MESLEGRGAVSAQQQRPPLRTRDRGFQTIAQSNGIAQGTNRMQMMPRNRKKKQSSNGESTNRRSIFNFKANFHVRRTNKRRHPAWSSGVNRKRHTSTYPGPRAPVLRVKISKQTSICVEDKQRLSACRIRAGRIGVRGAAGQGLLFQFPNNMWFVLSYG